MGVQDATVPFARVAARFKAADLVFSNLECCLHAPDGHHSVDHEGFLADPTVGGAVLTGAGIAAVGIANNVNYGEAAITGSIATLDRIGIPHTGAGANRTEARRPAIVTRDGPAVRFSAAQFCVLVNKS